MEGTSGTEMVLQSDAIDRGTIYDLVFISITWSSPSRSWSPFRTDRRHRPSVFLAIYPEPPSSSRAASCSLEVRHPFLGDGLDGPDAEPAVGGVGPVHLKSGDGGDRPRLIGRVYCLLKEYSGL
ncbi:hypothetical protein EYF80_059575 [Liparis tanakae]|uniref:Uncharacterized protein n=1 Tax=Liparis tanakae TaxID=230148 RepID=A0A4Z2EN92_9TELE|nr:hypothetical protein EYF80_059575 [Liparis tanakae]